MKVNKKEDELPTSWKRGTPCAVAYQSQEFGPIKNLACLVDGRDEPTELYFNELPSKIFEPADGDVFLFKNVRGVRQVSLLDGYCWRSKGKRKLTPSAVMFYFYAETEVKGVYHHRFVKNLVFNQETRRLVVQYKGSKEFSTFNRAVLAECPPEDWPSHETRRVPFSECSGPKNSVEAYMRLCEGHEDPNKSLSL